MKKIVIQDWKEVDIQGIATVTYSVLPEQMNSLQDTLTRMRKWSLETDFDEKSVVFLSYSDDQLVGWLMLYRMNTTTLEMNPGSLFGHPLIEASIDEKEILEKLIGEVIEWSESNGYKSIDITFSQKEPTNHRTEYTEIYNKFGFKKAYYCMRCDLQSLDVQDENRILHQGLIVVPLQERNINEIYSCYHEAFNSGISKFFYNQTELEKRNYFESLVTEESKREKGSLVLLKDGQFVGFTSVIPLFGDKNQHLMCICIHPSYRHQGLGEILLAQCMARVAQEGNLSMTLYTDSKNTQALRLYRTNNFQEGGGSVTFIRE